MFCFEITKWPAHVNDYRSDMTAEQYKSKGSIWNFEAYKCSLDSNNEKQQLHNLVVLHLKIFRFQLHFSLTTRFSKGLMIQALTC